MGTIMKWPIFNRMILALLIALLSSGMALAEGQSAAPALATAATDGCAHPDEGAAKAETTYERRVQRYRAAWDALIPSHAKLQFAGSMGFLSLGFGWDYGKRHQFDADILFGFIPKYSGERVRFTLTLKQNYYPWRISLGKGFYFIPLSMGIYLNTILSDQYWVRAPDRYPKGYYWFSTRVRTNVCLGEAITWEIPAERRRSAAAVSLYYEVGTNDFLIVSAWGNRQIKLHDIFHLSIGLKTQWL